MFDRLAKADKPIVLYGTGNAAQQVIDELNKRNIAIAGIFASDGFVRSRTFAGYPVLSYSEAKEKFGEMIVLLCFGSHLPDVIENFKRVNAEQEMYAPDMAVCGGDFFTKEYYESHKEDFAWAREQFSDEQSRLVFDKVLEYKLSGKIDCLFECETDEKSNWELLKISDNENFVDLGAYTGDTVREFLSHSQGKYSSIVAVEPETRNFRKLSEYAGEFSNCMLVNKAVGDKPGSIEFSKNIGRGGAIGKGKSYLVDVDSVDNMLKDRPVSIIKMDLEGQEQAAIKGASEIIKKNKPKMLISAYHKLDDLWVLTKLIKELNPEYKLYLRKDPCIPAWEINIYVI